MRQRLLILLYFAIFWMSFQIIIRAVFLAYNYQLTADLNVGEILQVFVHGLKMDISMSGYYLMLTSLILTISVFYPTRALFAVFNTLSICMIVISGIIMMVDIELYRHWGFRLDATPIFYVTGAESEAMGSVAVSVVINLLLIAAAVISISLFLYTTLLIPKVRLLTKSTKKTAFIFLAITGLLFIPIRGSLKVAPMNTGFVYFHKTKVFANHAAINVVWNFFKSLSKSNNIRYPENFFDAKLTQQYFARFYPKTDSTTHVFTTQRPNIILIIMESFTADAIEPLGGKEGLTPNLNALCKEGILFNNIYSTGDRTDKGVAGVLSAYPAQPITNIIKSSQKIEKLPYLPKVMKQLGYHTTFYHGGNIDFANFRAYFTDADFDAITTMEDFPDDDLESKWGLHDEVLFDYAKHALDSAKTPFFNVMLTLSSHEPFDVPGPHYIKGQDEESLFLNSIHYTDSCLGNFVEHAKKSSYWSNTVMILVADHGHRLPGNKALQSKERFHIPLLMVGGAVKKDSIVSIYGNQTDIANTILGQIDKPRNIFPFSKNLLSPTSKSFSFYFFNNGYGYVAPDQYVIFDHTSKTFLKKEGVTEEELDMTKAYQQTMFSDYNKK